MERLQVLGAVDAQQVAVRSRLGEQDVLRVDQPLVAEESEDPLAAQRIVQRPWQLDGVALVVHELHPPRPHGLRQPPPSPLHPASLPLRMGLFG
ncbi:MAG TPA: hypothetical protein VNJ70_18655 [Thermoanaerobaculia bacterium]|nr:hypothetical protein [Thermoanaerobaculia bacterium]